MTVKQWLATADDKDVAGLLLNVVSDFLTATDRDALSWLEAMTFFETVKNLLTDGIGVAEYGAKETAIRVGKKIDALNRLQ